MDETERKRRIELAKTGKLLDKDGNKILPNHESLRAPKPIEVIPVGKSDVAKAMELVAEALIESQKLATKSSNAQVVSIIDVLKQHNSVMIKPEPVMKRQLEQWEFKHVRDQSGKLISTTATQLRQEN